MVELRTVTRDNLDAVLRLAVAPAQAGLVATNAVSIAQAHLHQGIAWYRAIYLDDVPVGFVMVAFEPGKPPMVWRLMVDRSVQGKGVGRQALQLVVDAVQEEQPAASALLVSHVSADGDPGPFYARLGFEYTGEVEGGERVMRLSLAPRGPPRRLVVALLYPGCIPYEIMLTIELCRRSIPVAIATPDGQDWEAPRHPRVGASMSFADVDPRECTGVLVPGGDPASVLEDQRLARVVSGVHAAGGLIGAICAGPLLLSRPGLLRGRAFTHGYKDAQRETLAPFWEGATFVDAPLVEDDRVLTARAEAHVAFAVRFARRVGAIATDAEATRLLAFYGSGS